MECTATSSRDSPSKASWALALHVHTARLDEFGSDSVVVVVVEFLFVAPRVGEVESPARVEVHEIGEDDDVVQN